MAIVTIKASKATPGKALDYITDKATNTCGDCAHAAVCEQNQTLPEFSRNNPAYCKAFLPEREETTAPDINMIPVCEACGRSLGQLVPGYGIICSSSYIGGPLCHECQVEHCLSTNCLGCRRGEYPNCEHIDLKRFYQNPDQ